MEALTVYNSARIELLTTLEIPGFSKGRISQCSLAYSRDGGLLASAAGRGQVCIWEAGRGKLLRRLGSASDQAVACAFSPDGKLLATGGFDNQITLWESATGVELGKIGGHDSPIWELSFSPDGLFLASCSLFDDIRLWDARATSRIWNYRGGGSYLSIAFSPSGTALAFGSLHGNAGQLDATDGKEFSTLAKGLGHIGEVTFSLQGNLVAAATDDAVTYIWNAADGGQVAVLEGHDGYVNGVAFAPCAGSSLLATSSHDGTIRLWDLESKRCISVLKGHEAEVLRIAFSPDGTCIASVSWDGTIRLWGLAK